MTITSINTSPPVKTQNTQITYEGEGTVSYGGTRMSVMDAVAMLMMQRSETFSALAKDKMQSAQGNLNEIKEARSMLSRMKALKQKAKDDDDDTTMPPDMVEYCKKNGIDWDHHGSDFLHSSDEWDVNIQYMQSHLDTLTDSNQMQFLQLKSTVNKLDEAISGANKVITQNYDGIKNIFSR